jgi:hypothetical protein
MTERVAESKRRESNWELLARRLRLLLPADLADLREGSRRDAVRLYQ